nr:unnamed protein product [Digitaria exilis]
MADSHRRTSMATELEGTLLISGSLFPYFFLVALEAGGPLRAAALLAAYPLAALLGAAFFSDDLPLLAMTFLSTAGLSAADVAAVARATLPRFFLADLRATAFRAMARHVAGERFVVTRLPRLLAEPFVREFLGDDVIVAGAELRVVGTRLTGTVTSPPGIAGTLVAVLGGRDKIVDVGLCCAGDQPEFLQLCQERRVVSSPEKTPSPATPLPRSEYPKPLVFHDGRLVRRPEPATCLAILLWVPLGVVLSVTRLLLGFLPHGVGLLIAAATGFQIRADLTGAASPATTSRHRRRRGILFACNHQTLMDPMFHGSTVRGYKWLDSIFFLMNPSPWYEIRLLAPVATGDGGGGVSSRDVANSVQRMIGDELGFECTGLTRRDKYRMIAGHDGVDARSPASEKRKEDARNA